MQLSQIAITEKVSGNLTELGTQSSGPIMKVAITTGRSHINIRNSYPATTCSHQLQMHVTRGMDLYQTLSQLLPSQGKMCKTLGAVFCQSPKQMN